MHSKQQFLGGNPARFLSVRARVSVYEPRRELFQGRDLLLGLRRTVLQHVPLAILTPIVGRPSVIGLTTAGVPDSGGHSRFV